jgi:hypothetical protein
MTERRPERTIDTSTDSEEKRTEAMFTTQATIDPGGRRALARSVSFGANATESFATRRGRLWAFAAAFALVESGWLA